MSTLLDRERAKYETAWAIQSYAQNSPGAMVLPVFLEMANPRPGSSILDAGCGSGKGALALIEAGLAFDVTMCDLTPDGLIDEAKHLPFKPSVLWENQGPTKYDYVYCTDVLEHIPTTFVMLVVSRLMEVAKKGVFLSVSTVPDQFGNWVGEDLHHTVQPFVYWRDQLSMLGQVVEARDMLINACFFLRPNHAE